MNRQSTEGFGQFLRTVLFLGKMSVDIGKDDPICTWNIHGFRAGSHTARLTGAHVWAAELCPHLRIQINPSPKFPGTEPHWR